MRLTSAMWFAVFMRKETARGAFVTVVKSGAQQAGALFVIETLGAGLSNLYSPAPQVFFESASNDDDDRMFERVLSGVEQSEIDAYLEKQSRFDPDLWIIETEAGKGSISLELIEQD